MRHPAFRGAFLAAFSACAESLPAQLPREVEFQFNYRPAAFEALSREIGNISMVVPEWFFVDSTGALAGEAEQRVLELAAKHRVPVMAQVKNYDRKTGLFSAAWARGLLNSREARSRAIAGFIELSKAHRLYGIQVELEGVHISERDSLSLFIREAATALNREGFKLSVSAIHKEEEAPGPNSYTQWMYEHWRGAYDLRAIGQAADFVRAVVYAQHTRRTPPGPSQNLPWLERVMDFFVQSIPPEKLVIGLGMGAQHWYTVADPALYYQGARSWSRGIRRRDLHALLEQFDGPPLTWDDRHKMSFSYIERAGVFEWVVSDNDVRAFDAKLELAKRLGVRGVSMWVNGDEEPGIWSRFRPRSLAGSSRAPVAAPMTGVPVFLWHYFADSLTSESSSLTESYARFDAFLQYMKQQGFRSVFPEEARTPRAGGGKQVILTFDDGRKDQLRAAELLERHGFRGIFFVVPSRTARGSESYLTRDDLARMAKAGHRIAVHGNDHRSLASSGAEAAASVAQAYRTLQDSAGVRPSFVEFAMPFGHYTPEAINALATRYRYLMSVNPGYWDGGSVMIPRMLIFRDTPIETYREFLTGGSDFHPTLTLLTEDGARTDTVLFIMEGGHRIVPELFAVSADRGGKPYQAHPLGDAAQMRGDTLFVDLRGIRDRYFGADRNVIAYSLVDRSGGRVRYLTRGVMHWLRDPAGGPILRP